MENKKVIKEITIEKIQKGRCKKNPFLRTQCYRPRIHSIIVQMMWEKNVCAITNRARLQLSSSDSSDKNLHGDIQELEIKSRKITMTQEIQNNPVVGK